MPTLINEEDLLARQRLGAAQVARGKVSKTLLEGAAPAAAKTAAKTAAEIAEEKKKKRIADAKAAEEKIRKTAAGGPGPGPGSGTGGAASNGGDSFGGFGGDASAGFGT
jgi:hypothetical protein